MAHGGDFLDLNLNIKHLEYFLTVAQAGSINKAAQALYISQPYLGKLITDLENDLGTVLMQRFTDAVAEVGTVEKQPKMEGRSMTMFISAKPVK